MLKGAFEQFGAVTRANIAIAKNYSGAPQSEDATSRSFGRGVVEFAKPSVASDVLVTLRLNMFIMPFSSRPLRVLAYGYGPKRWSSKSPADDLIRDCAVQGIDANSPLFETLVVIRHLQHEHRAQALTLRHFQVQGLNFLHPLTPTSTLAPIPPRAGICKPKCYDKDDACGGWARNGECKKNPSIMSTCPHAATSKRWPVSAGGRGPSGGVGRGGPGLGAARGVLCR